MLREVHEARHKTAAMRDEMEKAMRAHEDTKKQALDRERELLAIAAELESKVKANAETLEAVRSSARELQQRAQTAVTSAIGEAKEASKKADGMRHNLFAAKAFTLHTTLERAVTEADEKESRFSRLVAHNHASNARLREELAAAQLERDQVSRALGQERAGSLQRAAEAGERVARAEMDVARLRSMVQAEQATHASLQQRLQSAIDAIGTATTRLEEAEKQQAERARERKRAEEQRKRERRLRREQQQRRREEEREEERLAKEALEEQQKVNMLLLRKQMEGGRAQQKQKQEQDDAAAAVQDAAALLRQVSVVEHHSAVNYSSTTTQGSSTSGQGGGGGWDQRPRRAAPRIPAATAAVLAAAEVGQQVEGGLSQGSLSPPPGGLTLMTSGRRLGAGAPTTTSSRTTTSTTTTSSILEQHSLGLREHAPIDGLSSHSSVQLGGAPMSAPWESPADAAAFRSLSQLY